MELALQTIVTQDRETEHKLRTVFENELQHNGTINDAVFFGILGAKPEFFEKGGKNIKATLSLGTRSKGTTAWHKVEVPVQPFPEVQDFKKGDRVFVVGNPEYFKIKDSPVKSIKFSARYVERVELPWKE